MRMPRLPKFVDAQTLYSAVMSKQSGGLRLLDCTYVVMPRSPEEFQRRKFYGNFEEQIKCQEPCFTESYAKFLSAHIPSSTHFNLALATHPTQYDKFALYPPEIFERYAQLLDVNSDEHLVLYSRGPLAGMMFAARAYWLFRAYSMQALCRAYSGHADGLSILDGGFEAWQRHNLPSEHKNHDSFAIFPTKKGNWNAKSDSTKSHVKFEDLTMVREANQQPEFGGQEQLLLDTRIREQYEGPKFIEFDPNLTKQRGFHLPGALNIPSVELIDPQSGLLKSAIKIRELIETNGLRLEHLKNSEKSLVALCNTAMQASLMAIVLESVLGLDNVQLYGGSMSEVQARAPELISERGPAKDGKKSEEK